MKQYYVYILTNKNKTVLYTGVTSNLRNRIVQHQNGTLSRNSFTFRYNCHYLLFYEVFQNVREAIGREKEIKKWNRNKKLELIKGMNPELEFLEF